MFIAYDKSTIQLLDQTPGFTAEDESPRRPIGQQALANVDLDWSTEEELIEEERPAVLWVEVCSEGALLLDPWHAFDCLIVADCLRFVVARTANFALRIHVLEAKQRANYTRGAVVVDAR